MSIANKPKIIVAAIACRPYVKAAVACGYTVVAIDIFADDEVKMLADSCYHIEFKNGQLDKSQLIRILSSLDLQEFIGFCYGAGFEKQPAILSTINALLPVIGNLEQAVTDCKEPNNFFRLCDRLQLPYPKVMLRWPPHSVGWLRKEIGASGGSHVKRLNDIQISDFHSGKDDVYYQQFQQGKPVSCLFIASNHYQQQHSVQVIGFNEQFISPCRGAPFRYGGAVSNADMSDAAKVRFTYYVSQLSQAVGLIGLNSCDAICDGDNIYLLEINPRLSATMDLYADYGLFEKHVAAVAGDTMRSDSACKKNHAHQVVYAKSAMIIKDELIWPSWVYDRPRAGSFLEEGVPVCTVVAEAETVAQAKSLVNERAIAISRDFLN